MFSKLFLSFDNHFTEFYALRVLYFPVVFTFIIFFFTEFVLNEQISMERRIKKTDS